MNKIILSGVITKEPIFSHEVYGEKFYELELSVARQSGTFDTLIILASETLLMSNDIVGAQLKVVGEIRTRNVHEDDKNRVQVFVFAREVLTYNSTHDENCVELEGYICKQPKYRETPLGREIADVLVACNRAYGKSDYIPTIAWGRNARRTGNMEVSTHIRVAGRLQSRAYEKKLEDGSQITRVAYELSVSKIEECEGNENE